MNWRLVLICAVGGWSAAAGTARFDPSDCETHLQTAQRVTREKLGYAPAISIEPLKPLDSIPDARRFKIAVVSPRLNTELGFLEFTVYERGRSLRIERIDVHNLNLRRKNLSNLMFAEMMELQPRVEYLHVALASDNLLQIERALAGGDDYAEAFRTTPMYRVAARYGFTVIRPACEPAVHVYTFVLVRGR